MLDAITEVDGAIIDAEKSIEEYKNAIISLYMEAFERENTRYSNQIGIREKAIESLERQIELTKSAGNIVGRAFYDRMIEQTEKEIATLNAERNMLMQKMDEAMANGVDTASEEWYEMVDAIYNVDTAIQDAEKSVNELKKSVTSLYVDAFERESKRYSNLLSMSTLAVDAMNQQMEIMEASGQVPGRAFYDKQIEINDRDIVRLQNERAELVKRMDEAMANGVEVASDEWYDMVNAVYDVDKAIQETTKSTLELKKATTQLYVDAFNREATRYSNALSISQKALDSISQQISLMESASQVPGRALYDTSIELAEKELTRYQSERDELASRMNEAMKNGVDVASDEWYEMVDALYEVDNAIVEVQKSINGYNDAIVALYTDAFNREADRYAKTISIRQKSIDALEKQIALIEASGGQAGVALYEEQIEQTEKQIDLLNKERDELMRRMSEATENGVDTASSEWYAMVDALYEVDSAIKDCETAVENFDNAILALHTEVFERIQNRFSSLAQEMSNMGEMFSYDEVATEDNNWTKEGLAQLGLLTQRYELAQKQVAQYNEEIAELNNQYKAGKYSVTEYTKKLSELKSEQWSAVQNAKSAKDSIVSLNSDRVDKVVQGIDKEISKYEELIQAQKDLLSQEKELHDYEKQIADENKTIESIQRQLNALSGDTSLSAAAKRAKLNEELQKAQDSLAETQYAHDIEMQQEALDKELENYTEARNAEKEALQLTLEEEELLIAESFARVKENAALIGEELLLKAQELNITMSEEITGPWTAGENAIAAYGETLTTQSSAFIEALSAVELAEWNVQEQANLTSESISVLFGNTSDELVSEIDEVNDATRRDEESSIAASEAVADWFANRTDELQESIDAADEATRKQEEDAWKASEATADWFAQRAWELQDSIEDVDDATRSQEQAAWDAAEAVAEWFSNRADELTESIQIADDATRAQEQAAWDASEAIADAFAQRADELVNTIEEARYSTENLTDASDALADSLNNSIDGYYSGASAIGALDGIADAARGVADAAREASAELERMIDLQEKADVGESQEHVTSVYGGENSGKVAVWNEKGGDYSFRAKGSKRIAQNELAWTQEDGPELIVSPTSGAILTPLQKGDMVLPTDKTSNMWEWGSFNPQEFANKLIQSIPNTGANVQTNTMQVGSLVTVNGNVNDSMAMMEIAAQQATNKIKQSWQQLSNQLRG